MSSAKISKKKLLRNYPYASTDTSLNRVFKLHHSFCGFFEDAYSARALYIPDIIGNIYPCHPCNSLKNSESVEWTRSSSFRMIHMDDVISNIKTGLKDEPYMILGVKISLAELNNSLIRVFGEGAADIKDFYDIQIIEPHDSNVIPDINYNIESALISHLQS